MEVVELCIFIFSGLLTGGLALLWFDPQRKLRRSEALLVSVMSGFFFFIFFIFGASLVFEELRAGILVGYLGVAVLTFVFWRRLIGLISHFANGIHFTFEWSHLVLFFLFAGYVGLLLQVMIWDPDGLPSSVLVGWGDGAYHLDIIRRLETADPFRLEQPIAVGEPLTYPVFLDFASAVVLKIGAPENFAWHFPVFLFGGSFFWLLWFFGKRLFQKNILALSLVFLIFFGGGLGFWWLFGDISQAISQKGLGGLAEVLLDPPHEYTHLDSRTGGKPSSAEAPLNIVWMVPAVSFFSHQRSFTVGAATSLLLLLGFLVFGKEPDRFGRWLILVGFLPLAHSHSFLAVAIIVALLFCQAVFGTGKKERAEVLRGWLLAGIGAILIALPQILFLSQAGFLGEGKGNTFFRPWFGWMTCTHNRSWLRCDPNVAGTDVSAVWFWTKNFGIIFWLWVAALMFFALTKRKTAVRPFFLPSMILFALPNLLLFQPWEFDNNKMLFYWWFLGVLVGLAFIEELFEKHCRVLGIAALVLFLVIGGLSGTVDVWARVKRGYIARQNLSFAPTHFGYYGKSERAIANWIKSHTGPNDGFLTGDGANQFIPMTTGRPIYLGFPGWLWTQGRGEMIALRKERVRRFSETGNAQELCSDGVRYWLFEAAFVSTYTFDAREALLKNSNVVFEQASPTGPRQIIQLSCQNS